MQCVDCCSVCEKMFANLVIQITFSKDIIQENVHKCTKIHEIREHSLSQTISDIQFNFQH